MTLKSHTSSTDEKNKKNIEKENKKKSTTTKPFAICPRCGKEIDINLGYSTYGGGIYHIEC